MRDKLLKIRYLANELIEVLDGLLSESEPIHESSGSKESDEFMLIKALVHSEEWPEAVPEFQITDQSSESDKNERAETIADLFLQLSPGKKFLDFGCGEGHVAKYVSKSNFAVGYDISPHEIQNSPWEAKSDSLVITSDFNTVISNGPYDEILIYDVLDHAEDPVEVLKLAKSVLSESGFIRVRCHPWCSRHGGHLYRQINKAFVHLVFSESELSEMGIDCDKTIRKKVIYPIATYEKYISDANLSIVSMDVDNQDVESFFSENSLLSNRIKISIPEGDETKKRTTFPEFQLQQCFLDFVLELP